MIERARAWNSAMVTRSSLPLLAASPPRASTAAAARPATATPTAATLGELVAAHADFLWRQLRRLGVPEAQVDDALQRVFLTAARRLSSIDAGRERAFLFSVVRHTAAHVRRDLARLREQALDDAAMEIAAPGDGPDEQLDAARARALLDIALDAMDDDLREVFVLAEIEGLSGPEIGDLVGLPTGTVASRLRRARASFQAAAARLRLRIERGSAPWLAARAPRLDRPRGVCP